MYPLTNPLPSKTFDHAPHFSNNCNASPRKYTVDPSVSTQTEFALRLFRHVGSTLGDHSNFAFSPLSIHAILALIASGAGGPTRDQVLSVIGSSGLGDLIALWSEKAADVLADGSALGGPTIKAANGFWIDKALSVKRSFMEIAGVKFKAEIYDVDFQNKVDEAVFKVNSWVARSTSGLIKEILFPGSVNRTTGLVFCNALYFKGAWETQFNTYETQDSEFFLLNRSSVEVKFMTSREDQFMSFYNDFSVLRLPYKQGANKRKFSMYIFLPDAIDGLWNLLEKLHSESRFLDCHLPRQKVPVGKFKIPKFKFSFDFDASKVLKSLGLMLPFTKDEDLTEMVNSDLDFPPVLDAIFHKAFIDVNEEGTEEVAITDCSLLASCGPPPKTPCLDFVADHPFVFLIREDISGAVLFTGHVLNPSLASERLRPVLPSHDSPTTLLPPVSYGAFACKQKISMNTSDAVTLIGWEGIEKFKQVVDITGARLAFRDHESDAKMWNIEIEGTLDQVGKARKMVDQMIANVSATMQMPLKRRKLSATLEMPVKRRKLSATPEMPVKNLDAVQAVATNPVVISSYKIRLCKNFENGSCTFGKRCRFAHGASELR